MQHIGMSKSEGYVLSINYPQLRLPQQYFDVIGDVASVFETDHDGRKAFLIVTEQNGSKDNTVLKPCANVAQSAVPTVAKNERGSTKQPNAEESSKSTAESFIIDTWLVSCAASGSRFACVSPGSVAAYHGALSRAPPYFEPLLIALGTYRTLSPFYFDLVSDKTRVRCHTDSGNG